MSRQIHHHTVDVNGTGIFYREAGDPSTPSLLLLHGFPSSSVMFNKLMTALADQFHLIAPDYPGFGFSDFPDKNKFSYTFKNIAGYIYQFTEKINLGSFTIYLHDYGCPIGLYICIDHPEKIEGIIVQDGNAYNEGLGPEWDETKDYWSNPTPEKKTKVSAFLSEEGIRSQYTAGLPGELADRLSPELWTLDWERMQRTGNADMQFELNTDYQNNLKMYPVFQEYFRKHQPPALIVWGKHDPFFRAGEAICYKKDLPAAGIHLLEGSHMLLETNFDEMSTLICRFMHSLGK